MQFQKGVAQTKCAVTPFIQSRTQTEIFDLAIHDFVPQGPATMQPLGIQGLVIPQWGDLISSVAL